MIEPIDPDQGGIFNLTGRPPRTLATDHLGLIQTNDRFGQGIVVGVANGSDRSVDACFGQATGVSNQKTSLRNTLNNSFLRYAILVVLHVKLPLFNKLCFLYK